MANGVNFSFTAFLTVFAVRSEISLSKAVGARATAAYFAAAALMRFISIFCIERCVTSSLHKTAHLKDPDSICRLRSITLILADLVLLVFGSILLLLRGSDSAIAFFLGICCVGAGNRLELDHYWANSWIDIALARGWIAQNL